MSAIRYSGQIKIRVTYLEPYAAGDACPPGRSTQPNGEYRCFLRVGGWKAIIHVNPPAVLSHGVDSPEAFDEAARAAIAFADHEYGGWNDFCAYAADGSDRHVGRSPSQAWPQEKAKAV
jgi:hypothetical protein